MTSLRDEARRLAWGTASELWKKAEFAKVSDFESALLAFAKLVLEDCAKICDHGVKWTPNFPPNVQRVSDETAALLAKSIRAMTAELLKELEQ